MHVLLAACAAGLLAGFLLLRTVPLLPHGSSTSAPPNLAVIIPARNEEKNLPVLLQSLHGSELQAAEIVVVDDDSTDKTAEIARSHGACVLPSAPLPAHAIGKSWACAQGAQSTVSPWLLFLDADTYFVHGGLDTLAYTLQTLPEDVALSILPFHRMQRPYEHLSLFFNLLTAIAATGFGGLDRARLVGPSLLIHRSLYQRIGGHSAVQQEILENLRLAERIHTLQGSTRVAGGRAVLETRMFPEGFAQLCESWRKTFAAGAGATAAQVLVLSILWLSAAITAPMLTFCTHGVETIFAAALYVLFVVQIAWLSRQLGTFRWLTALLYPMALGFYFLLFGQSLWTRLLHRPIVWRGRAV